MPTGLPAYRRTLEPAMWVLHTKPELVLKSRWVLPEILTEAGFEFQHPELDGAVAELLLGRGCGLITVESDLPRAPPPRADRSHHRHRDLGAEEDGRSLGEANSSARRGGRPADGG
ncbi:DUF1731 domain-containing protein [Microbacterium lushaniae]|nr:DUF1731 domain-containing protein [Microbacterium lushaniae]